MRISLILVAILNFFVQDEKFEIKTKPIVKRIIFLGNEKTKSEIIARELTFAINSELDTSEIEYNENRIYGTGLFNKVKIWVEKDSLGDSVNVYVWVNERWYIWPFPIFGWRDRDLRKLYYGAGLIHTNFRGRNEKIIFSFALGYDPWVEIEYINPWILGSKNLFYSAEIYYQRLKSRSKSLEEETGAFYEDNLAFNFLLGKRFGLYKRLWGSAGFRSVSTTGGNFELKTISPSGTDRILVLKSGFRYDTRDIPVYPNTGLFFNFVFGFNKLLNHGAFFLQGGFEVQAYQRFLLGLFAGRFFVLNSIGRKIPSYSRYYFGYQERLRGYFNEIFEGENIIKGTVEYRIPIIKQTFVKWEKAPLEEFSILRFGIDFTFFGDIGKTWFNSEKFFKLKYLKGYGVGVNFLLPYDLILSLEFARNDEGRGQFIVDFGSRF
ncbi:MAG: POTRA domain-containing protein [Candidatus Kryptonium sp.]